MFRFLKNHLQGACFALLKLQVLIYIYIYYSLFGWCGSMPVKLQKQDLIQSISRIFSIVHNYRY